MKKTLLSSLLLFVAAATLSNCSKDKTTDPATADIATISATVEEPTRTTLDGTSVKWVAGDKILLANVADMTKRAEYTLKTGEGTTSGTFTGVNLGKEAKFALYPYRTTTTCASGKFSIEMPATQENCNGTFDNGANPMIAKSDANGVLNFKNVCGAIRLQLKGTQKVSKIVVSTATTAEKLSGKATVALNADGIPVLTLDAVAANTVTLNCNNAQLDATAATPFYVVVPAATYTKGLQFMIYDETGAHIYSLPTSKELIVTRSQVAPLPVKTVKKMKFPDPVFRAALAATPYELKLTADGDIDVYNAENKKLFANMTKLDVQQKNIKTLQGIEYFTGLNTLYCHYNQLTSLDISKNTELTIFYCYANQLTSLDISTCPMLTKFGCGNQLANGVIGTPYTKMTLTCSESQEALIINSDETIHNYGVVCIKPFVFPDANFRAALAAAPYNLKLTTNGDIDVINAENKSKFTSTKKIDVSYKKIASLKGIEYFTKLETLNCGFNLLTSLDLSQNMALTDLACNRNQLTSLDIQPLTSLTTLDCGQQLAGGATAPSYSELKLHMTQAQFNANLGTGYLNDKVTRVPPDGK